MALTVRNSSGGIWRCPTFWASALTFLSGNFGTRAALGLLLGGALLSTGCQSTSSNQAQVRTSEIAYPFFGQPYLVGGSARPSVTPLPPPPAATNGPIAVEPPAVARTEVPAAVPVLARPEPAVIQASLPALAAPTASQWIAWDAWVAQRGLGKPRNIGRPDESVFESRSTNGSAAITLGHQTARINGIDCWLGFAPRSVRGQAYIHALDAQKTLQPILDLRLDGGRVPGVIVIDPGHGGVDSGSRNVFSARYEKEYTLDWARRLKQLLVTNGWEVHLTRTNDIDLSLVDRVAVAERVQADIFLSLHFNSFAQESQAGLETYCLTPVGMPSSVKREFVDDATVSFPNNSFDAANVQLAAQLHHALLRSTGANDRGVRRARFMGVLRNQKRPAVLIEGGYLSNPREAASIAQPEYRQRLAVAVAKALQGSISAAAQPVLASQNPKAPAGPN
jgi:N-acetylmuramoyl-L-alanine amidase